MAKIYETLGAHSKIKDGVAGTHFAVLAPEADEVSLVGDWNDWKPETDLMVRQDSGIWECFVPHVRSGSLYKYHVQTSGVSVFLQDPYAFGAEYAPQCASRVWDLSGHTWKDGHWMRTRRQFQNHEAAIHIYEIHIGSWKRVPEEENRWLSYREIAAQLAHYMDEMGFTHVKLLFLDESYPGTPAISAFAPTARYGSPDDLMFFIDSMHRAAIGVILECDPGSALFWLDRYHADGLRLSGTSPEILEEIRSEYPDVFILDHDLQWNSEKTERILEYMETDPILRSHNQRKLVDGTSATGPSLLPLSQQLLDVSGQSLLSSMAGDTWQKFAGLRLLHGFLAGHPGKKLLFMGGEFGQWNNWNPDASLDWHLLELPEHQGIRAWVRDLNRFYRQHRALSELDFDPAGFEWIDHSDHERSILSFLRFGKNEDDATAFVCNFTPVSRNNYQIGVPWGGFWKEVLNSDSTTYGGSGQGNLGGVHAAPIAFNSRPFSLALTLPPLSVLVLQAKRPQEVMAEDVA